VLADGGEEVLVREARDEGLDTLTGDAVLFGEGEVEGD
jgi:hypothetical protein